MNIEDLLNKYFEGETSCEEERQLRQYFTQGMIPKHLEVHRPMFTFLNKENKQDKANLPSETKKAVSYRRRLVHISSGIAAGVLIILAIAGITRRFNSTPENYVIINGEYYTNTLLVHEEALAAFQEVSFSKEEVFATLFAE